MSHKQYLSIWKNTLPFNNCRDHVNYFNNLRQEITNTYIAVVQHLDQINDNLHASKISVIRTHFDQFDEIKLTLDRSLLNLFIYVQQIKTNYIGCHLDTNQLNVLAEFLTMIDAHRKSLTTVDYVTHLQYMSQKKERVTEVVECLTYLMEKRVFCQILNGLAMMNMIIDYTVTFLERHPILDSLSSTNIKQNHLSNIHNTMYM